MTTLKPVNPDYRPPKLETLDPVSLQGRPVPERRWTVPGWIPDGQVTLIAGDGGVGKSLLNMQLLTACATGGRWIGEPVKTCKAMGFFCEDDGNEIWRRQVPINQLFGVEFGELENLMWIPRIGFDNSLITFERFAAPGEPTEFFQQVHDAAQNFGAQLLVLDSLHDLFPGNENNRVHARQFIQLLTSLAQDIGGAVVVNAHPSLQGLQSGSGTSGSTAWSNAVRSRLYLQRPEDATTGDDRILARKKANYASIGNVIKLVWRDGVFVDDRPSGGMIGALSSRRAEQVFLNLVAKFKTEGRHLSASSRASNYAPRLFADRPTREGFSKADFRRGMESLFEQGKIRVDTYAERPSRPVKVIQTVDETKEEEADVQP